MEGVTRGRAYHVDVERLSHAVGCQVDPSHSCAAHDGRALLATSRQRKKARRTSMPSISAVQMRVRRLAAISVSSLAVKPVKCRLALAWRWLVVEAVSQCKIVELPALAILAAKLKY